MNNNGDMYMTAEMKAAFEEAFGKPVDAETGPWSEDALAIEDQDIARELAGMNRAARRAFMSERRRGSPEAAAIEAARATLKVEAIMGLHRGPSDY